MSLGETSELGTNITNDRLMPLFNRLTAWINQKMLKHASKCQTMSVVYAHGGRGKYKAKRMGDREGLGGGGGNMKPRGWGGGWWVGGWVGGWVSGRDSFN